MGRPVAAPGAYPGGDGRLLQIETFAGAQACWTRAPRIRRLRVAEYLPVAHHELHAVLEQQWVLLVNSISAELRGAV